MLYEFIKEAKNILYEKPKHLTEKIDLPEIRKEIENKLEGAGDELLKLRPEIIEEFRLEILALIDAQWENHLAEIHEVEDEIFLKGMSSEDPTNLFIKEADAAFHDMRLDFTRKAAESLVAKTANLPNN